MRKWEKKLTAMQRKHMQEMKMTTLDLFRRTREAQARQKEQLKKDFPTLPSSPCADCDGIARRLGWD